MSFDRKISDLEWREWQIKSTIVFLEETVQGLTDVNLITDLLKLKARDLKINNPTNAKPM